MNEKQTFEGMLEKIGGLINTCTDYVEKLRQCNVCIDFYQKKGEPENAPMSKEELLEGREYLFKQCEEYNNIFKSIRTDGAKASILETLLLTSFEWTSENKEPNFFLNLSLDLAYDGQDTFEQSYANAIKVLEDIGMNEQARVLEGCIQKFYEIYKPFRDAASFEGDDNQKEEQLMRLKSVCDHVDKFHSEMNYYVDAFYKENNIEKKKATNFFIKLGAENFWCDNQMAAFALKSLNAARMLRDTTILAARDEIDDAVKDELLTGKLANAGDYFDNLDLIDNNIAFYSKRLKEIKREEDSSKIESYKELVKEEFPLQPYQDMVLNDL